MAIKIAGVDVINDDRELVLAKLTDIHKTENITAVDVFIYDTSKDSDGGAWRHRTQHTSWYNEGASSTRGSRKEFPAVAVIVAEASKVTIYDGDDPSLPMWRTFTRVAGWVGGNGDYDVRSISAINGVVALCSAHPTYTDYGGIAKLYFVADTAVYHAKFAGIGDKAHGYFKGGLATTAGYDRSTAVPTIVSAQTNDVAMTVLPNAPTDPATGIAVPTIAIASDGGVSVIKDDGTVVDSLHTYVIGNCAFNSEGIFYSKDGGTASFNFATFADIAGGDGFGDEVAGQSVGAKSFDILTRPTELALLGQNISVGGRVEGTGVVNGVALHAPNYTDFTKGMSALTTSSYNTGWMNGDIKLAALADTTAETLSGSAINDTTDFTTDWVALQSGWTINTTSLVCDGVGSADLAYFDFSDAGSSLGIGDFATIRFTVSSYTSGSLFVSFSNGAATTPAITSTGDYEFVQQVTANDILYLRSQNFAGTITSVEITAADPDRSVNGNGLGVHGSITKAAVATGADVVAYSGFSSSNYLEQPYNADLDFGAYTGTAGTGDFCVMGWGNSDGSASRTFVSRGDTSFKWQIQHDSTGLLRGYIGSKIVSYAGINDGNWHHIAMVRSSGTQYLYVDGVQVDSLSNNTVNVTVAGATVLFGIRHGNINSLGVGKIALWRISATAPTADQIKKIYEDEKFLFQPNAKATLYGSSDAVTALAHDPVTDLLHVGTSSGRSVFQGLRRVDNTTTAVSTAISANDSLVVEQ